jgi:hypothetical protein
MHLDINLCRKPALNLQLRRTVKLIDLVLKKV